MINEPITHEALLSLGYTHHYDFYKKPPIEEKIHGLGIYILMYIEKEWTALLTNKDLSPIRTLKTLGELQDFHQGMCGTNLFKD